MSSRTAGLSLFGALLLAAGIAAIPVWIQLNDYVFNTYDLGIFAQALYRMGFDDPNPFLTTLNTRILNDHYQPILWVGAPLAKIMPPLQAAVTVENVLVGLSLLPLLPLGRRGSVSPAFLAFAAFYLLLNKGVISALQFPVHPTTWAVFPMVALGVACRENRRAYILAALTLLFQFKEEFCFVGFMLAAAFLLKRDWRFGIVLLVWSGLWTWGVFWLRPALLGPVFNHGDKILGPLLDAPVRQLTKVFTSPDRLQTLFQCLIPLAPVWIWAWRKREPFNGPMALALLPLLAIRFIGDAWQHHYMAPVAAGLLVCWLPRGRMPGKICVLAVLLALLAIDGHIRDAVDFYIRQPTVAEKQRLARLDAARDIVLGDPEGACLAQGNLVPALITRENVFMLGGAQTVPAYRYVFVEKPPHGDPWPLTFEDIDRAIRLVRHAPRVEILIDDERVFLARGRFKP